MRYLLTATFVLLLAVPLCAQSQIASYLRKADKNRNGKLEPSEISEGARPHVEKWAREARISLSRPVSISQLEAAGRRYYEREKGRREKGGWDRRGSSFPSSSNSTVPGFGPDENTPLVVGFGPDVDIRHPFTSADVERAEGLFQRYDKNHDGYIDGLEAKGVPWNEGNPFLYDFNKDNMISRIELAQRYARRRRIEGKEGGSDKRSSRGDDRSRSGDDRRSSESREGRGGDRREPNAPRGTASPSRKTWELAYSIVSRHDRNRSGKLERPEWLAVGDNIPLADTDRNGEITPKELGVWLAADIQRRHKDFSAELPGWFFELDANDDHQISMSEFTQEWDDEKLDEFTGFDRNGDGFLTEKELLASRSAVGGTYSNEKARVILPAGTVASDIVVNDDYLIGDLDVKLSITHTNAEQLNAYLIGPDETRIELFTGVGRHDDHFDGTILDDEASELITRSRPPFRGKFKPESFDKKGPTLSHYYGKSIHGIWQLEIRTSRGDRPGMLHGWSLIVRRPDELDSEVPQDDASAAGDGVQPPSGDERSRDEGERPSYDRRRGAYRGGYSPGQPSFRGGFRGPPAGERG